MPNVYSGTGQPDFSGIPIVLGQMGKVCVKHIVQRIYSRIKPDGSMQKQNAPSTILAKGHDHPLIGGSKESPLLARETTYTIDTPDDMTAVISIKPERANIAYLVEEKGYEFFAISEDAEQEMLELFGTWMEKQVDKYFDELETKFNMEGNR